MFFILSISITEESELISKSQQNEHYYVRKAKAEKKKKPNPDKSDESAKPEPITISEALLRPEKSESSGKGKI